MSGVVYNPFERSTQHNPFPTYRRLRDEAPVYCNPDVGFWALSRHQDVVDAHLDPSTYISSHGITIEGIEQGQPLLILKDQPEHTWHRKVVARVFTPRRVNDLEPYIRRVASALLDAHEGEERFDAVADFSIKLPLDVISELIGLPPERRHHVHELSDRLAARDPDTSAVPADALAAQVELYTVIAEVVAERRAAGPTDDVISLIMATEVEDGNGGFRTLDDWEITSRFIELAFAGHETVAKLIGNGVVALAWYPDQRRELVADPSLIPAAIEEMLRWDPPSHYQGRWTTRDVELHGVTIPADSRVILITGSATHDERAYDAPDLFDIHRKVERPVSFGFGIHLCLGAALARLETRVAFEELLARFPDYDIDDAGVVRQFSGNVRGLTNLPVVVPAL